MENESCLLIHITYHSEDGLLFLIFEVLKGYLSKPKGMLQVIF